MARALKHLRHDLKIVDLVVELLDARIPASSRNPVFAGLLDGKKHLILLHKADRAEDAATERWLSFFSENGISAMAFSVQNRRYLNVLLQYLKEQESNLRPGRIKRPLRMMIVGIPNVGKSTMINYFVNKAVARTGNQPGVTRGRQWIRITPGLELLDTPGVLWPRVNEETTWPLAVVGAVPTGRLEQESVALWLINFYLETGKEQYLLKRYPGLTRDSAENMLNQIGVSQGCLIAAGKVDLERAAVLILRDFQAGTLGKITMEEPAGSRDEFTGFGGFTE
jgi:ribosome biogenesis GTPase A